jgi:hypothetical protein
MHPEEVPADHLQVGQVGYLGQLKRGPQIHDDVNVVI